MADQAPISFEYPDFHWDFPDEMPYGLVRLYQKRAILSWEKGYLQKMQVVSISPVLAERYVERLVDVTNLLAEVNKQLKEKYNVK
jgi:hypothetical protein